MSGTDTIGDLPHVPSDPGYPKPGSAAVTASMRGNRRRNTKPELRVRRLLHAAGLRYRVDYRLKTGGVTTKADIVFTRRKVVAFIDGCFWHGCKLHSKTPSRNVGYWGPKLARNAQRDREVNAALRLNGWTVLRFWEHDSPEWVAGEVARVVSEGQPT